MLWRFVLARFRHQEDGERDAAEEARIPLVREMAAAADERGVIERGDWLRVMMRPIMHAINVATLEGVEAAHRHAVLEALLALQRAYQALDENQDGALDLSEFAQACDADPDHDPGVRRLFDMLDEDKGGSVDIKELVHALRTNAAAADLAQQYPRLNQLVGGVIIGGSGGGGGGPRAGQRPRNRPRAGFLLQARVLAARYGRQLTRMQFLIAMDGLLIWFAALFIAFMQGSEFDLKLLPANFLMLAFTVGTVTTITGLRLFGTAQERVVFWRERKAGLDVTAHYAAKNAVFLLYDHVPRAVVYTMLFYVVAAPFVSFGTLLGVNLLVCFASSGLGVMLSTFLAPSVALVTAIITTLAVGGLLAGVSPTFPAIDARFWPPFASLMRVAARQRFAEHFHTL